MKSAIKKLFNLQYEFDDIPVTEEWKRLAEKGLKVYHDFYSSLNDKQKQQFDEIYDYLGGQENEVVMQYYEAGFKLGLMLAVEAAVK